MTRLRLRSSFLGRLGLGSYLLCGLRLRLSLGSRLLLLCGLLLRHS